MTKRLFFILFSVLALFPAVAQTAHTPATVPNVQLQDYRQFVSNPDGILSQTTVDEINRMCLELKEKDIAQVVVLMLDSVDPAHLDRFAFTILNNWGVGTKSKDNGLVISVVKQQRDIQFETGYGLEGVLPDAICKRIQTTYMTPHLREGNWDEGVLQGVRAVYDILMGNEVELGGALPAESGELPPHFLLILLLIFGLPILLIVFAMNRYQRKVNTCPVCGTKGGLQLVKREVVSRARHSETVESTYKCRKCGHILTRRNTHNTGGGGGMLLGGGLGGLGGGLGGFGGGRGGGFGGGFGGGMSGGGGARTRF